MAVIRTVPASFGQRLLGVMEHYRAAESPLAVPSIYRLRGKLSAPALHSALDGLVARHEALRTTYRNERRRLTQEIHEPASVPIDWRVLPDAGDLNAELVELIRTPFDLSRAPLRVSVIELASDDHVLLINIHHLSTDGWSGGVLSQDLGRLYRPAATDTHRLDEPSWQYADFSERQRKDFEGALLAERQQFWRSCLEGIRPPSLPELKSELRDRPQLPGTQLFQLPDEAVEELRRLCRAKRVTLFAATLAVFGAVMHARTGDTDFGIASMFANRPRPELTETVGYLANLLVLRLRLPERPTFGDLLEAAQDMVWEALAHQDLPYHLVPQTGGERAVGLEKILFQVMSGPDYRLGLDGLEVEQLGPPSGAGSRFDLEFALMPKATTIGGVVWFDQRRFDEAWIRGLVTHYCAMATAACAAPGLPVADLAVS